MKTAGYISIILCAIFSSGFAAMDYDMVADAQTLHRFLGGRNGILVFNYSDYKDVTGIFYLKIEDNALSMKKICNENSQFRSLSISPDGKHIAYARGNVTYIRTIMENSPDSDRRKIGDGKIPHWWIHPATKEEYIVLTRSNGIYLQKLDASRRATGNATKLFDDKRASGGRSMDGRFLAADLNAVMWEITPVEAVSGAKTKNILLFTNSGGCFGSLSPSLSPDETNYGCTMHFGGGGHAKILILKFDPGNKPVEDLSAYLGEGTNGMKDTTIFRQIPVPGSSYDPVFFPVGWKECKWSTHDDYGTGLALISHSTFDNYYRDIFLVDITNEKAQAVFYSKQSNQTFNEFHLWVEQDGLENITAVVTATPVRGTAPLNVTFDASLSSANNASHLWTFGDGSSGAGKSIQHTYTTPGSYSARLIVKNANDADTTYQDIIVDAVPAVPNRIEITPSGPVKVIHGQSKQFSVQLYDVNNQEIYDKNCSWSIKSSRSGSIDQNGLYKAGSSFGQTDTVIVQYESLTARCIIRVIDNPIHLLSKPDEKAYTIGGTLIVNWETDTSLVNNVTISFSNDSGKTWAPITTKNSIQTTDTSWGTFVWNIPSTIPAQGISGPVNVLSDNCKIKIADYYDRYEPAVSEGVFSIKKTSSISGGLSTGGVNGLYRIMQCRKGFVLRLLPSEEAASFTVSAYDLQGKLVFFRNGLPANHPVLLPLSVSGMYLLEIKSGQKKVLQKLYR